MTTEARKKEGAPCPVVQQEGAAGSPQHRTMKEKVSRLYENALYFVTGAFSSVWELATQKRAMEASAANSCTIKCR